MSLAAEIVERTTLSDERGNSGNTIERVTLTDGRTLILKTVSPEWDWISRATNDDGRIVRLWEDGVFDSMPPSVDTTILDVESGEGRWSIFMRDVAECLLRDDIRHGRDTAERVLGAAADLHRAFWDSDIPGLCSIEDRYRMLSPATAHHERASGDARVADLIDRSWTAFYENFSDDLAGVIGGLVDDPSPLADELRTCRQTLIHGDLRIGNVGYEGDRTILVDWGERAGIAPPAVELAWFIAFDAKRLDMSRDDIVQMFRGLYGDRFEDRALQLGLIGGLVHAGAHIGLGFVTAEGDSDLEMAKADVDWWTRSVSRALETWSP